jgi:hypothetical protein
VEGYAAFEVALKEIRESILNQEARIFTNELTLFEALVAPFRAGDAKRADTYRQLIEGSGASNLIPATREIYVRASLHRTNRTQVAGCLSHRNGDAIELRNILIKRSRVAHAKGT